MRFRTLSRLMLLAVLVVSPWLYGSVQLEHQVAVFGGVLLAAVLWAISTLRSSETASSVSVVFRSPVLVAGLAIIGFEILQIVPLGLGEFRLAHSTLAEIEPTEHSWRDAFCPSSIAPALTKQEAVRHVFAWFVAALSSMLFVDRQMRCALYGFAALNGVALAVFGCVQKLTWNGLLFWTVPLTKGGQPFASYVNRNNAAGYLALAFACAVGLYLALSHRSGLRPERNRTRHSGRRSRSHISEAPAREGARSQSRGASSRDRADGHRKPKTGDEPTGALGRIGSRLALCAAVVIGSGILASSSRSGVIALAVMGVVAAGYLLDRRLNRARILGLVVIVLVAGSTLVASGLSGEVSERMSGLRRFDQLTDGRFNHWRDTLPALLDFPVVGTGVGTYAYANRPYQRHHSDGWYMNADSEYVEWLIEGGLVGFCLVALFCMTLAVTARRLLADPYRNPTIDAGVVLLLVLVGQATLAAADFGISMVANQLLAAAIVGSVAGRAIADRGSQVQIEGLQEEGLKAKNIGFPAEVARRKRRRVAVTAMCLTAVLAFCWWESLNAYRVEQYLAQLPEVDEPDSDLQLRTEVAINDAADVIRLQPLSGQIHFELAKLHLYRLRLVLLEHLRTEQRGRSDDDLWPLTDPANLLAATQISAEARTLAELLPTHTAKIEADRCLGQLDIARQKEPLLRSSHLLTACLGGGEEGQGASVSELLSMEGVLWPVSPDDLSSVASIAAVAGEEEVASKLWSRALSCEDVRSRGIIAKAVRLVGEPAAEKIVSFTRNPEHWISFAEVSQSRRTAALEAANELITGDGTSDNLLRVRVASLSEAWDEAVKYQAAAVASEPLRIDLRVKLAQLYERTGQIGGAIGELEAAINLSPNRKELREKLADLRRIQTGQ